MPSVGSEVVVEVCWPVATNAAVQRESGKADATSAGDVSSDGLPAPFEAIPSGQFDIAASETPPGAQSHGGGPCQPADKNANYELTFSADGQQVRIVRIDPVQEIIYQGALEVVADRSLV